MQDQKFLLSHQQLLFCSWRNSVFSLYKASVVLGFPDHWPGSWEHLFPLTQKKWSDHLITGLDGLGVRGRENSFFPWSVFCAPRELEQKLLAKVWSYRHHWMPWGLALHHSGWSQKKLIFLKHPAFIRFYFDPSNFQTIPCLVWKFTHFLILSTKAQLIKNNA